MKDQGFRAAARRPRHSPRLVLAGAVVALLALSGTARAASTCGETGVFATAGLTASCTYTTAGEDEFFAPAGISEFNVVAVGGAGGSGKDYASGGAGGSGGDGARVAAVITAATPLYVEVGAAGADGIDAVPDGLEEGNCFAPGGFFGGGRGGLLFCLYGTGGGGGGASDVRTQPQQAGGLTGAPGDPRLVVAGGGGGGGGGAGGAVKPAGGPGGDAGQASLAGAGAGGNVPCVPGEPGGDGGVGATGGAGGTAPQNSSCLIAVPSGSAGSATSGGAGGDNDGGLGGSGGGGGGGYIGGGGGGTYGYNPAVSGGGGGAGSSFGPAGSAYSTSSEAPVVVISWSLTTTTLSAAPPSPSTFGQAVTLTATVAPEAANGTVAFQDGGATIPGCGAVALASNNTATCTTSSLAVGSHAITASYSGDPGHEASTSSNLSYTVNRAATTTTLTAAPPSPSPEGTPVTFTATVSPTAADGTVEFSDGASVLAGCGAVPLAANNTATCTTSSLTGGSHTITAVYSASQTHSGSDDSITHVVVVNRAPVATHDAYAVIGGGVLDVPAPGVLGNDSDPDGDPLTAQLVDGPATGLTLDADGGFTYAPGEDTAGGTVTFTYRAFDGNATSNVATVTITVTAGCDGVAATRVGTAGHDRLDGTSADDVIVGLGGNDTIDAGSGHDRVCGGSGDDRVELGSGDDRAFGGTGDDRLDGGSGSDRLFGEAGVDRLFGGGDHDRLDGGADNPDRCDGEGGADTATAACEVIVDI